MVWRNGINWLVSIQLTPDNKGVQTLMLTFWFVWVRPMNSSERCLNKYLSFQISLCWRLISGTIIIKQNWFSNTKTTILRIISSYAIQDDADYYWIVKPLPNRMGNNIICSQVFSNSPVGCSHYNKIIIKSLLIKWKSRHFLESDWVMTYTWLDESAGLIG